MLIIFNGVSRLLETMQVSRFQTFPKIHVLLDLQPNQPSPSVAVAGGPPSAASQWRGIWRNAHSCWWNQLPQQQTVTWHEIAGNLEDQFTIKLSQARQKTSGSGCQATTDYPTSDSSDCHSNRSIPPSCADFMSKVHKSKHFFLRERGSLEKPLFSVAKTINGYINGGIYKP